MEEESEEESGEEESDEESGDEKVITVIIETVYTCLMCKEEYTNPDGIIRTTRCPSCCTKVDMWMGDIEDSDDGTDNEILSDYGYTHDYIGTKKINNPRVDWDDSDEGTDCSSVSGASCDHMCDRSDCYCHDWSQCLHCNVPLTSDQIGLLCHSCDEDQKMNDFQDGLGECDHCMNGVDERHRHIRASADGRLLYYCSESCRKKSHVQKWLEGTKQNGFDNNPFNALAGDHISYFVNEYSMISV
jgi:hypothetical protein